MASQDKLVYLYTKLTFPAKDCLFSLRIAYQVTVEVISKTSAKTEASLYNGQPLDTGSMCHGTGPNSCTPPTLNDENGVSVENVPIRNKQWFVVRVSYGRIDKAKTFVETRGLEYYVPLRYKEIKKQGKKRIITTPLLSSFIFVHATTEQVETLLRDNKLVTIESRPLLSYYFDHTIHRQDTPDRNPPLTIRDGAMNNFIHLTSIKNQHIISVTSNNIQFKLCDKVVVTKGEFKGIHGRVARFAGQQRVVVELFDGCFVATAYVPKEAMTKSETLLNKSKI